MMVKTAKIEQLEKWHDTKLNRVRGIVIGEGVVPSVHWSASEIAPIIADSITWVLPRYRL